MEGKDALLGEDDPRFDETGASAEYLVAIMIWFLQTVVHWFFDLKLKHYLPSLKYYSSPSLS